MGMHEESPCVVRRVAQVMALVRCSFVVFFAKGYAVKRILSATPQHCSIVFLVIYRHAGECLLV